MIVNKSRKADAYDAPLRSGLGQEMIEKSLPILTQIVGIPISIFFLFFVIIPDRPEGVTIIYGLITFSAILAALCFSASGTYPSESNHNVAYREAGGRLFEATVLGAISLAINYTLLIDGSGFPDEWPKILELFVGGVIGLIYAVGVAHLHMGIWLAQRQLSKWS